MHNQNFEQQPKFLKMYSKYMKDVFNDKSKSKELYDLAFKKEEIQKHNKTMQVMF